MLVVGIDPSAKHIALVGYETMTRTVVVQKSTLYPKGATRQTPESLANALSFMESAILNVKSLARDGQRFAYVETPVVGRGGISSTMKQSYVGGIIRGCLAGNGFEVRDANPSTWRKGLGIKFGPTEMLKAQTRSVVVANLPKAMPRLGDDLDLMDAAGITLFGLRQLQPEWTP